MNARPEWLGGVDPARRESFQRAMNVAGAGASLLQTYINKTVQQVHLRELGAAAVLPRRQGSGNAAYINRRTPGAAADWVADTDSIAEATGTHAQVNFPYKTLATRGRVTRGLQAKGRSYGDVLAGEMSAKAGDFTDTFEAGLITGDEGVDANQFNGLITLTQATAGQIVIATTNTAGDAMTLEGLDEAIDKVKGAASRSDLVILGSFKAKRLLNSLLQAQQQFNEIVEIGAGFRVRSYDGIPVVTTTKLPDVLAFNGSKVSAYTGGATTALLIVNTRYVQIEELTPLTVMPLAKTDSQFDEFDMFWDGSVVLDNPLGASIYCGIAA